ncbi:outer membrane beta-barrel family protein [Flavobacterium sasangense]|uniref:outer membrane beta-barrel family protein n=1 Tax=Flavobacterium sasangense TaxID=503361 RepID=UPI00068CAA37|nr:outer membrane beta-barrel family protein [Flavobacterium sasangense]
MTKSHLLALLLIVLYQYQGFSQIKISGQIEDNKNNPIEFVEVQLQNKDSIIFKSELTNAEGKFVIETEKGEYSLIVRQLGVIYHKQKINVNQDTFIGIINITEKEQQLQEVVIISKKKLMERKVDRLIFNVENSISASGGDAIDALKITPSIRIQNDQISMIGKNQMGVMVDDKLIQLSGDDLINFLKTISSDNIKNIEVITTPPAKYSAEGNSGLVNIKLKKSKKDSWNASINSAYRQATYATGSVGGNFNYQKNKISIFSNVNSSNGATAPIETSRIYYPNQLWSNKSDRKDFVNNINARIGIDYQISKKVSMGLQYLGSSSKPNIDENNLTSITNNLNQINSFIKTDANNKRKNYANSLNWHTAYEIDTIGTKISIDFDYFKYNNEDDRIFKSNSLDSFGNITPNTHISANNKNKNYFSNYSGSIDVEMPLKWANLSYGGKISFNKNNSDVSYFDLTNGNPVFDQSQSNQFNYDENIVALYFSGTKEISKKWEAQIGLRMESTITTGISNTLNQQNNNNYTKLFPTCYITYKQNENNMFSLNYSKRINRPLFFSLNPFRWYSNQFSYSEGNPFLQPSYTHNLEFVYTNKQNWESKIYFSNTNAGISQVTFIDNNSNIQATQYLNSFNTTIIGLSESYTFDKIEFWESYNSLDLTYNKTNSLLSFTNQKREGVNTYFSTNNTFFINKQKTIILNLNFWLSPNGVSDLDESTTSNQLDISMKFFFFEKNLQLALIGNDIFSSNRPTYISYSNNIKQEYNNYYDQRFFRLSLTYKLGNSKIKTTKRKFSNETEQNRIK